MDSSLIFKIIVSLVYGIVLGLVTIPLSKKLALKRTEDPAEVAPLNRISIKVLAVVLGIASVFGLVFTAKTPELLVRDLLLIIPIFSLSFVDSVVRKIPNSLLLAMLVTEIGYLIYYGIHAESYDDTFGVISGAFIGFFVGMIVCTIPSILKIPIGAGDVKYSAIIGICLGAAGYFQAMMFMFFSMVLVYIYLKISKKGDLKTQLPMAPVLSFGTVVTMCFSVFRLFGVEI
ncbi:MAG: hypothetical protein E7571_05705 [Ruminococcaceae bacterium]|jgi:prepilin signal peptidase PulO-like enzyme (type II secretory pathway)|nr:hypothetical protein [Oscillospiraceae bacterium]